MTNSFTRAYFYPRDRTFWKYNLICWPILIVFYIVYRSPSNAVIAAFVTAETSIIVFFGLHSCLAFRYFLLRNKLRDSNATHLISAVFVYSCVCGAIIGVLIAGAILLLKSIFAPDVIANILQHTTLARYFFSTFMGFGSNVFFVVAIWCFLYIALLLYRKSTQAELIALKLENSLKEAQLNALTGQLNPHFLFNALNNIRFMMRKNVGKAELMVTNFSDILRYSLESSKQDKVKLRDELEIVDQYIMLTTVQLGHRLTHEQNVDNGLDDYLVPPLILQMLVENAVKHGLDHLKEGGRIAINISRQGEHLLLEVENDFADKMHRPGSESTNIGLANIRQRLKILYGDKAEFLPRSENGKFNIKIRLPQEIAP